MRTNYYEMFASACIVFFFFWAVHNLIVEIFVWMKLSMCKEGAEEQDCQQLKMLKA